MTEGTAPFLLRNIENSPQREDRVMSTRMNHQIVLAARPHGEPKETDFRLVETPVPEPGPGQMLLRTLYLSLDPYMRGRMSAGPSYVAATEIGDVMGGGTVCRVEASHIKRFRRRRHRRGLSPAGRSMRLSDGRGVRKLDPKLAPITTALGVLGMPGLTAWTGLMNIGQPKPGETVVVAAASGAVGSVVGQLAKLKGCHAVGIAGGEKKCRVRRERARLRRLHRPSPRAISPRHSRPPAPRASTSTSRMSAALFSTRSCHSSTRSPACRSAA